jgi:DNA-binding transcriptional LysR family regulator
MLPNDLSALATFLLVAEERSFTPAAKRQPASPSAVSHAMRTLEEGVGVRLLSRTTRSVGPHRSGRKTPCPLKARLRGSRRDSGSDFGANSETCGTRPASAAAFCSVFCSRSKLGRLHKEYPEIVLDVTTDDSRRGIVADGFDAGIHIGEYIEKDMIAVRVENPSGWRRFGSSGRVRRSANGSIPLQS